MLNQVAINFLESVSVREMNVSDAEQVASLSEQLSYEPSAAELADRIESLRRSPDTNALFVCVTQYDEKVIGWIHVYGMQLIESVKYAEIGGLVVDNQFRRRGVGRNLIETAERWARDREFTSLRLRSGQQRQDEAHRFYLCIGYEAARVSTLFRRSL